MSNNQENDNNKNDILRPWHEVLTLIKTVNFGMAVYFLGVVLLNVLAPYS